jgi:hypothetical protein
MSQMLRTWKFMVFTETRSSAAAVYGRRDNARTNR